jgi:hypothetical protein
VDNDIQQHGVGEGLVLPSQRQRRPPPYTGKVLKEKTDARHHGVSPSTRQERLESLLDTLKGLADAEFGAASVLTNLHHKRIAPLMERELRIYEMSGAANPTVLVCSWLLHECLPPEYAATRARRAISLKSVRHGSDDIWLFVMLPDAPAESRPLSSPRFLTMNRCDLNSCPPPPSPRAVEAVEEQAPQPGGQWRSSRVPQRRRRAPRGSRRAQRR